LNEYFVDKIINKFQGTKNKIIALSVGLPYTGILKNTNKLHIFDYIFCRTQQDKHLFKVYFDESRIFYMPDLSYLLTRGAHTTTTRNSSLHVDRILAAKKAGRKIASISLSRHIYSKNHTDLYAHVLQKLGKFIEFLVHKNFHIVFLPFNTNPENTNENDTLIHSDLYKILRERMWDVSTRSPPHVTFVREGLSPHQTMDIISHVDVCIPMRFHAILFAAYNNKPFFPIFTTRKVRNLLLDMRWHHAYELDVNDHDLPTDINIQILCSRFDGFLGASKGLVEKLRAFNKDTQQRTSAVFVSEFTRVFWSPKPNASSYTNPDIKLINSTYDMVKKCLKSRGLSELRDVTDNALQNCIAGVVSYTLTNGQMNSMYTFGLKNKMFSKDPYNHVDEWMWILNDIKSKPKVTLTSNPNGLFDIGFIDQVDRSGSHRCGWQYVYENLSMFHNDKSVLLDLYVDRTFHWSRDICELVGIVPYRKPWRGFIHHTFDTSFSVYNNVNLLKLKVFQQSLENCKGLFVLSKYLQKQLQDELKVIGYPDVPVHALVHPTELHVPKFDYKMFLANPNKKLLHVGGWLRNVHSFYELNLDTIKLSTGFLKYRKFNIQKNIIKGKNMSNYFPQPDFLTNVTAALTCHPVRTDVIPKNCSTHGTDVIPKNCSTHGTDVIPKNCSTHGRDVTNNWYKHFLEHIHQQLKSVPALEHLQNDEYDTLLSYNIVFINLVDASAVNTLIECIVRHTPIFVNRHPAALEVLGQGYPLFYDTLESVSAIFKDPSSIQRAHKYLKQMDKSKFDINTFIQALCKLV